MNREEYQILFHPNKLEALKSATSDLSWLLTRGYTMNSSLKMVGDRYRLHREARSAVKRAADSDQALERRIKREISTPHLLRNSVVWIDGFNILITVERALKGDPILQCRDQVIRDIASVHGTYRRGKHTIAAFELIHKALSTLGVGQTHWLFDQPVSNSGRAAEIARNYGTAEVVHDPDQNLIHSPHHIITISGDGEVIERASQWFNLTAYLIKENYFEETPWLLELS